MRTILVRYKTALAHAASNEALVHAVFDELRASAPEGIRYATYRLEDGVSFVHLATLASASASAEDNPLTSLPSFKAFQADLKSRCVEPPVVTTLLAVDSYGPAGSGGAS